MQVQNKVSSVKMGNAVTKSVSPSLKMKRAKMKSIPFGQMDSKISRTKNAKDSPCSSFTAEAGNKSTKVEGKNLIDEFNQKYAASENNANIEPGSEENSESENGKTIEMSTDRNVAIIHVIDETKKRKQDFKCSISKLLKHMKYFEK